MRRLIIVIALMALIGFALWHINRPEPVAVAVQTLAAGPVEATVANTRAGTIKACRRSRISPPAGGQVSVLQVREGDRVEPGQVLLELWNEDLRAQLRLAESELSASRSRTEEVCLRAEEAEREANRLRPLRRQNLISEEQLDQAETGALAQAASCRAAKSIEEVNEAQVAVAQAALERTILQAPFAGIVAEVTGEMGEIVTPSPPGIATPPAVDLLDCSCVYVSAPIDEVDAPAIQVQMPARITLDAFSERVFPGKVRRIAPYVLDLEKQARTVEVEVEFDDVADCQMLLPGYSADIEVILEARPEVLRIPTEAVLEDNQVLVLTEDGTLEARDFEPGLSNWRYTEVQQGLESGDQIVTSVDREGVEAGAHAVAEL